MQSIFDNIAKKYLAEKMDWIRDCAVSDALNCRSFAGGLAHTMDALKCNYSHVYQIPKDILQLAENTYGLAYSNSLHWLEV